MALDPSLLDRLARIYSEAVLEEMLAKAHGLKPRCEPAREPKRLSQRAPRKTRNDKSNF
jgi:hypothetical protein